MKYRAFFGASNPSITGWATKLPAVLVLVFLFLLPSAAVRAQQNHDLAAPAASASLHDSSDVRDSSSDDRKPRAMTPVQVEEMRAQIFMARKDYLQAVATYEQLLKDDPKNAPAMNQLGIAYLQLGDLNHAEHYYKKAVSTDKKFLSAINNLGAVEYEKKRYGKAVKLYEKTIERGMTYPAVYSNLGYAYCGLKEYPKAMDAFGQALARDPNIFQVKAAGGSILEQRSSDDPGTLNFMIAKSFGKVGDAEHAAHFLKLARDDGYKNFRAAEKDPDFAMVIKDKRVQDVLLFQPAYAAQPAKTMTN